MPASSLARARAMELATSLGDQPIAIAVQCIERPCNTSVTSRWIACLPRLCVLGCLAADALQHSSEREFRRTAAHAVGRGAPPHFGVLGDGRLLGAQPRPPQRCALDWRTTSPPTT